MGLFIVFKFNKGELDTSSRNGDWGRMPPARTYDSAGKAKAQWTRYQRIGFESRAAEVTISDSGFIKIAWCDKDWVLKPELCKHSMRMTGDCGHFTGYQKCLRRKGHTGIHWSGKEAKKDPDFDPEAVSAL